MALVIVCMAVSAQAQDNPRKLISAERLATQKPVKAFEKPYALSGSAKLIYDQCGEEIGIAKAEADFFAARHERLTRAYLQAFEDAFVARMKAPSPESIKKDYAAYLAEIAKPAIERTKKAIASAGCTDKTVVAMVDYYRKIETAEKAGHTVPLTSYVDKAKKRAEERAKKKETNG